MDKNTIQSIIESSVELYLKKMKNNKKIKDEILIDCIINSMEVLNIPEDIPIEDSLIKEIEESIKNYKKEKLEVLDKEKKSIDKVNKEYNKIAKEAKSIEIKNKNNKINWNISQSFEENKKKWNNIQDRIDKLYGIEE